MYIHEFSLLRHRGVKFISLGDVEENVVKN